MKMKLFTALTVFSMMFGAVEVMADANCGSGKCGQKVEKKCCGSEACADKKKDCKDKKKCGDKKACEVKEKSCDEKKQCGEKKAEKKACGEKKGCAKGACK